MNPPLSLAEEMELSVIPRDLWEANFFETGGKGAANLLFQEVKWDRSKYLKSYNAIAESSGGWYFSCPDGIQVKLKSPRTSWDGKAIKYESQRGTETGFFRCQIPGDPTYWDRFLKDRSIPVLITEGAKKTASLQGLGYATIGVPGIWNFYGKNKLLKPSIAKFLKGRKVIIVFDQDTKEKTIVSVKKAINRLATLLIQEYHCKVATTEWDPELGKGVDDVHYAHGPEVIRYLIDNAKPFGLASLEPCPPPEVLADTVCSDRYLPVNLSRFSEPILLVKSPLGSGKTKRIADLCQGVNKVHAISYRKTLARQLADRLGIVYKDDVYHSAEGFLLGGAYCVESAHRKSMLKFNAEETFKDQEGVVLVLDEMRSILSQAITGSTCYAYRKDILINLANAFKYAEKIIGADGHLGQEEVDLIKELSGRDIRVIENYYQSKETSYNYHLVKTQEELMGKLVSVLNNGGSPFILTGGQKAGSTYSAQNIRKKISKLCPNDDLIVVDSETLAEEDSKAKSLLGCINETLREYRDKQQRLIPICSPSIESGFSIDEKYFTDVFYFGNGLHDVEAVSQSLMRIRDTSIPRHIFVPETSVLGLEYGGGTTFKQVAKAFKSIKNANNNIWNQILRERGAIEILSQDEEGQEELEDSIDLSPFLTYFLKKVARKNLSQKTYKRSLVALLESEGHALIEEKEEDCLSVQSRKKIKKEMLEIREESVAQEEVQILNAKSINDSTFESLVKKVTKTKEEKYQVKKGKFERDYGVVTPEILSLEKKGLKSALLHRLWTNYPETFDRDANRSLEVADFLDKQKAIRRQYFFDKLEIKKILAMEQYANNDEFLIGWNKLVIAHRKDIQLYMGISIGERNTPCKSVMSFLHLYGFKLKKEGHYRINGQTTESGAPLRVRVYSKEDVFSEVPQETIFDFWRSNPPVKPPSKDAWGSLLFSSLYSPVPA